MSMLLTLPLSRVTDANANPLSGALLYAYLSGTTTPTPTYTTAALSVQHTNPIVADGNGLLPAIYLDPAITYRFKAKTAAGADISGMDFDPVSVTTAGDVSFIQAGVGAVSRTVQAKLREVQFSVLDFYQTGDSDETAAWQRTVEAVNNSTAESVRVIVPPAPAYSLDSAALATDPLRWYRDNVTVQGFLSPITLTGTSVVHLFHSHEYSHIRYKDLHLIGNNQATAFASGAAIAITNQDLVDITDFSIEGCIFDNFKADYWVYVEPFGLGKIRDIRVHRNQFISRTGNARGPTNVAINSAFVGIFGSATVGNGVITDVWVSENRMSADYIKTGVQIMHNVRDFHIISNHIKNAGAHEVTDDSGAYAILVYETYPPAVSGDGEVVGNIVLNSRSCAIYQAGSHDGMVYSGNIIRGQTDTMNGTIPKGGICLNGGTNQSVVGNTITDMAADGIFWAQVGSGADENARLVVASNIITDCTRGVVIQSALEDSYNVNVTANSITECTSGIYVGLFTSATLSEISIEQNNIRSSVASSYGIRFVSTDASYKLSDATVRGNKIKTTRTGIEATNLTVGPMGIAGNYLYGPFSSGAATLDGSTKLTVGMNAFHGQTAASGGFCFRTSGSRGAFAEQQFHDCETAALFSASGAEDLGLDAPTWSPTGKGVRVHMMANVEAGVTPQKYILTAYHWDATAWRPLYTHTEVPS